MPGTHPQSASKKTIKIDPQPLSKTAKGGQITDSKTLQKLILVDNFQFNYLTTKCINCYR